MKLVSLDATQMPKDRVVWSAGVSCHSGTSRSLCAMHAMELFSTARSTSPSIQRWIIGRGRARSRCSGCLVVVVLSLFALLGRWVASALPDPAPVSTPVLAARHSVGGLFRACGARHVQARLRGGGGGCVGARHGGRLFAGAASVWAFLAFPPLFLRRSVRTPDVRGRSHGRVRAGGSVLDLGSVASFRIETTRWVLYCLPGESSCRILGRGGLPRPEERRARPHHQSSEEFLF